MKTEQCFTLFNIAATAPLQEVKRAYKNLASRCHPDKYHNDPILKKKAAEKMKALNTAYAMLTDRLQEIDVESEPDGHADRRRHPRNACLIAVNHTTRNRSYSSLHDSIKDISAVGVFIRTNEYYQIGQSVKLDGVAKTPIYCVVAHFCSFGIPHVWPQSQKYTTPGISNFLLSHPETFCELIKLDFSLPKFGDLLGLSGKVTRLTSEGIGVEFLIAKKYQKFIAAFM